MQNLLTVQEAADRLNISRTTLYQLLRAGEIRSLTIGRARRIPADEIAAFIHRHQREGVGS